MTPSTAPGAMATWEGSRSTSFGGHRSADRPAQPEIGVGDRQLRGQSVRIRATSLQSATTTRDALNRYGRLLKHAGFGADIGTKERLGREVFRRVQDARPIGTGTETAVSPNRARLSGPVHFLKNLLDTWELQPKDAGVLLGMDPDDGFFARDLLNGQKALRGRDAKDRIAYLYRIRKILSALFRDEHVEHRWLREPHAMLDGRSPMALILDGSMEHLLVVKEYVEAASGD